MVNFEGQCVAFHLMPEADRRS